MSRGPGVTTLGDVMIFAGLLAFIWSTQHHAVLADYNTNTESIAADAPAAIPRRSGHLPESVWIRSIAPFDDSTAAVMKVNTSLPNMVIGVGVSCLVHSHALIPIFCSHHPEHRMRAERMRPTTAPVTRYTLANATGSYGAEDALMLANFGSTSPRATKSFTSHSMSTRTMSST